MRDRIRVFSSSVEGDLDTSNFLLLLRSIRQAFIYPSRVRVRNCAVRVGKDQLPGKMHDGWR